MHRLSIAAMLFAGAAGAVIVDRIAVSVGARVITDSEIEQRIRLTAFQNGVKPDFSAAARRTAAEMLIDGKIVQREMDVGHYPKLAEPQRRQLLIGYARTNFKGDQAALNGALASMGLTAGDLEDDLARQSDLLTFLSLRFRPAVQVSDGEVRQYFNDRIRPAKPGEAVSLNDFRASIEQQLASDRADSDLEAWLRDQRRRTRIEYLEADLRPQERIH
jgi:hypothetical protein